MASAGAGRGTPPAEPAANPVARVHFSPAHKFRRGGAPARPALPRVGLAFVGLLLVVAGCGGGEGIDAGATVNVYAAASLCSEAKSELARDGGRAGDVRVRVVCLPSAESSQKLDLAMIGANARHATEDSSSIGYIGEPTRAASRFSEPILETAGIAQLTELSGAAAMKKLLQAVAEAGNSDTLRASVLDKLE